MNAPTTDFELILSAIDTMIAHGEDAWIAITEASHAEESDIDARRWNQCDLAARVVKSYGDDAIGKFASDANLPQRRAQEYRTMGLFYSQRSARAQFLAENPIVTYSHMRSIARRAEGEEQAYAIAHKVSMRSWTVEKTDYMLWRWAGLLGKIERKKVKPPKPIMDETITVSDITERVKQALGVDGSKRVRVVLYEVAHADDESGRT